MRRRKPLFFISNLIILMIISLAAAGGASAQCYGSLMLVPGFFEYDYLVRMCVHFGDASSIPDGIICSRSRMPGEDLIQVPVYFYNAHEGISKLIFAIESNDSIVSFSPENCFSVYHLSYTEHGSFNRMNIKANACMPICGPALAGYVYIAPAADSDLSWINIVENEHLGRMTAYDEFGNEHYMFSPHHGGYVGSSFLYTCQEPICPEPNLTVMDLEARAGFARSVRLTWIAGEGNYTIIRARTDRYPTGYEDGRLVVEMPSMPGQEMYFFDTEVPDLAIIYYKAFSLTKDGAGNILNDSFVECSAADTAYVRNEIAAENTTWGSLKKLCD